MNIKQVVDQYKVRVTERVRDKHHGEKDAEAFHIVRRPSRDQLEKYRKESGKVKGTKIKPTPWRAAKNLWLAIVVEVVDYEGLPDDWKAWFVSHDLGKTHVERVVNEVVDEVMGETEYIDQGK